MRPGKKPFVPESIPAKNATRGLPDMNEWGWRPKLKPGVNYSHAEVGAQLEEIGKRIAISQSHSRISRELGMGRDLVIIRARQIEVMWREAAIKDRENLRERQREELRSLREKLWEDWERSRQNAVTRQVTKEPPAILVGGKTAKGAALPAPPIMQTKDVLTTAGRYGDPAIAAQIRATIETEAKLFGTNAPDVVEHSWTDTVEAALSEGRRRIAEGRAKLDADAKPN